MADSLTDEEVEQLLAVIEAVLEEGYDVDGADGAVLASVREKLRDRER